MNDKPAAGAPRKLGLRRIDAVPTTAMPVRPAATRAKPATGTTGTGKPEVGRPVTEDPAVGEPVDGIPAAAPSAAAAPPAGRSVAVTPHPAAQVSSTQPWAPALHRDPSPLWPAPKAPASPRVLVAGAVAGVAAAAMLPVDVPGVGWVLTGAVAGVGVFAATGRRSAEGFAWAVAALLLVGVSTFLTADWLFSLCLLAACAAGSLAVTDGRTLRGVVLGGVAVGIAAFPSIKWAARGIKEVRPAGQVKTLGRTALISAGLLLVFVPLLAGADAAFAGLLGDLVPEFDITSPFRWGFLFVLVGLGTIGACYVQATTLPLDVEPGERRTVARREWAVPIGLLVAVFAVFVGVQLASLFGGDDYVQRTAELTYAEYARSGFWQLLVVTALTLVVIAVATRFAATETDSDRLWLRILLGGLAGLTLVIVASALSRMWAYQQAYGFTALRLLVFACEVWLAAVYVMVIGAGVKLRAAWLPRSMVATGIATLLVLSALNPDRFIAEHNVERFRATGKIDLPYLATLSVDAVPAFDPLGPAVRDCLLAEMKSQLEDTGEWYAWNLSRERARPLLDAVGWDRSCDLGYTTTR
ncbi:DUF4153 domain-containing protein [Umezawaea sp. Da 62-37]|uniref:DUF4153 domain-containing protein n=1 Tax=Umezawaea sp. Da 62-37 TaxID=3075927 RepID=UPI0028F6D36E|nr:DUF4153 domain-containing protein [Umezawaea sp. Da 62-37]WNV90456.1 DUF4153 domain-containing protein [Umezawaea sp. Da 62-37]